MSEEYFEARRSMWPGLTDEEILDRDARLREQVVLRMQRIADHLCVTCGDRINTYEQVGRCVYGDPCGHRQYQGKVPG